MTPRVDVKPELLRWARERALLDPAVLVRRFPKYLDWERGRARPTLKQLEAFAKASRAPVGYFFLPEVPIEEVPIPDFRTVGDAAVARPSPEMLDTVYLCQQRQDWYREFTRVEGEGPRRFVGSASVANDVETTAAHMRRALGLALDEHRTLPTWSAALRRLAEQAEALGALVMISGTVGNSTRRRLKDTGRLSEEEFRVAYGDEIGRLNARPAARGGSFHPTLRVRVGRRFGYALVTSTLEGRTSFSESLRLLGIRKMSTFREFAETVGAGL